MSTPSKITVAKRGEGVMYGLFVAFFTFTPGVLLCLTVIGAVVGIPMILIGLWNLVAAPWAYRKLRAGACPVCGERCVFPPKIRARKCPDCKTRLIVKGEELCKVEV